MRKLTDRPGAALILAAGYGSRMGSLTATQPKCLLAVGGRRLIEAQVGSLERFGVHDITVVVMKVKLAPEDLERARHLVAPVAVPTSERVADAATG